MNITSIFIVIKDLIVRTKGLILLLFFVLLISFNPIHIYFKALFSLIALFLCKKFLSHDSFTLPLFLFSALYGTIAIYNGFNLSSGETICYFLAPLGFYVFGKHVVSVCDDEDCIVLFYILCILFFGLNVYHSTVVDMIDYGIINIRRSLIIQGYGDGEDTYAATLLGVSVSTGFAGLSYFMACKRKLTSILSIVSFCLCAFSIISVVHLINRTGLVIFASVLVATYLWLGKVKTSNLFWGGIAIALLLMLIINNNVIDAEITDAYTSRNNYGGDSMEDNTRFLRWIEAIGKMFEYPLGWATDSLYKTKYVHNLWFDSARITGILPFGLLFFLTCKSISKTRDLLKTSSSSFTALLLGLNICVYLTCMVEPIIEGNSIYFYFMCMLWGSQNQYYNLIQ